MKATAVKQGCKVGNVSLEAVMAEGVTEQSDGLHQAACVVESGCLPVGKALKEVKCMFVL